MGIPTRDRQAAILLRESADGYGYALYKPAPEGWPTGFLVITKAGKGKKRGLEHVKEEQEARKIVERFKFAESEGE